MKGTHFDPFEAALLDALRSPAADASVAARRRVEQRLGLGLAAGAVTLSVVDASAAPAQAVAGQATSSILGVKGISLLAALVVGGALGPIAALSWTRASQVEEPAALPPAPRAMPRSTTPVQRLPALASVTEPSLRVEPESKKARPARSAKPAPRTSAAVSTEVEDDGALLERGRAALARSDSTEALRYLSQHEQTHPQSPLIEEREALAIKALAAGARIAEARARLDAFARRYPKSLFLLSLRAALGDESVMNGGRTSQ